jgi:hypothetical protein
MLEVAIMIEGQNGLTWPRWQKIVRLVSRLPGWPVTRTALNLVRW